MFLIEFSLQQKSSLHTAAKGTLNKQAAYIKKSGLSVVEGHADERGTREYNLGIRRKKSERCKRLFNVSRCKWKQSYCNQLW